MAEGAGGCGLVIVLEAGEDERAHDQLAAALGAARIATVVIEPALDETLVARHVQPLIELAQRQGAAVLLANGSGLARALKADGVHLSWSPQCEAAFAQAREDLGSRFIVGADAGRSRDDAMSLGELGADYVAFGVPDDVKEQEKARERRLDLVAWWAEIFEVPCIALDVESVEEASALASVGADFIAVRLAPGESAQDVSERIGTIAVAAGAHAMAA